MAYSGFMNRQETAPEKITALTGGQTLQTQIQSNPTSELNFSTLADRVTGAISEIHLPVVVKTNSKATQDRYLEGADQELIDLAARVADGQSGVVRGIHIPGVFSLPVVQQPNGDAAFVSEESDTLTQFSSAAAAGVTGILAHNYLAGDLFYGISTKDIVYVVYGDGTVRRYQVEQIDQFERLERSNLRSQFVELGNSSSLSSDDVFNRFYRGHDRVTFQTCLARFGIANWGLTFTTALPLDTQPLALLP